MALASRHADHQLRSSAKPASISALLRPGVESGCYQNHSRADRVLAWRGLACVLALVTQPPFPRISTETGMELRDQLSRDGLAE